MLNRFGLRWHYSVLLTNLRISQFRKVCVVYYRIVQAYLLGKLR